MTKVVTDVYNGWNDDEHLDKMKKCPFCGGTGVLRDNGFEYVNYDPVTEDYLGLFVYEADMFWCKCKECESIGRPEDTPEEAIEAWNRRVY